MWDVGSGRFGEDGENVIGLGTAGGAVDECIVDFNNTSRIHRDDYLLLAIATNMDEDQPLKRKFDGAAGGSKKAAKTGGGGGTMSFAQKMMAKMGYQEGKGLGKEGEGMVNPIEVKLRPQGAGVGTIKEKTAQYKDEQKRAAERRGEEYEDSSEEERKARRERRKKTHGGAVSGGSGTSTPGGGRRPKTKYRTAADVAAVAPGLDVPSTMLRSIVDATGHETKMLTNAAGLMTPTGLTADSEADKIAKRERMELEAFIEAWHGVQEQKVYIEEHEGQHQLELDQTMEELQRLQSVTEAIEALRLAPSTHAVAGEDDSDQSSWTILVNNLETIQTEHQHGIDKLNLSEAAVGALAPAFKERLVDWEPLHKPDKLVSDLTRIRLILGLDSQSDVATASGNAALDEAYGRARRQKATTPYETLMYTVWLPKIRTATLHWSVLDHEPMVALVRAWRPLLPAFIYSHLIDQLVVPKLVAGLQAWDPRKRSHHHKRASVKHAQPHTWSFPWLPYLLPYHLDPKASDGLMVEFKRRLRQVLDAWDVSSGTLPGLSEWKGLLRGELDHVLVRHLLPRLATCLSNKFEIDASDQDLTPLEHVLAWQPYFKTDLLARLMVAEFFPKWLSTLHLWLTTADANFEEIDQWFQWWTEQLPEKLSNHPDVAEEWNKGTEMINAALELLDRDLPLSGLRPPAAGPAEPITHTSATAISKQAASALPPRQEVTYFKDIVEAWCADEDLMMVPLREPHPKTGLPLFRITASATGKGGVVVCLQGDLIWAQKKNDREAFEMVELEEKLVQRAEGK